MAKVVKQLKIRVADKVGKLAEVTEALKAAKVNIVACCAWVMEGKGHMLLLTDDNAKARKALVGKVEACETATAVALTLPHKVGALADAAAKLAQAGLQVHLVYATTAGADALVLLSTSDDKKAASLI